MAINTIISSHGRNMAYQGRASVDHHAFNGELTRNRASRQMSRLWSEGVCEFTRVAAVVSAPDSYPSAVLPGTRIRPGSPAACPVVPEIAMLALTNARVLTHPPGVPLNACSVYPATVHGNRNVRVVGCLQSECLHDCQLCTGALQQISASDDMACLFGIIDGAGQ